MYISITWSGIAIQLLPPNAITTSAAAPKRYTILLLVLDVDELFVAPLTSVALLAGSCTTSGSFAIGSW